MNVGGTARYVSELVANIPGSALATGHVQGDEIEDSCVMSLQPHRITHLGRKISILNDIRAWNELRRKIREIDPLIVHTHTFKAGLIGRLISGGHKRVHTFHGHLFDDESFSTLARKFITTAEKVLAYRTDLLISVGEKVGMEIRAAGIGKKSTWLTIAPGVLPLSKNDKKNARNLLNLPTNGILVGWMARMTQVKNPMRLLNVAKYMPDTTFVMAGGGDLLNIIKKSAPRNVQIIGWSDSSQFWSAVDCAISTSDNEGMPIALIEAQLHGLPVVATNVGSTDEVIKNNITGIITSKKVSDLVIAIQKILGDLPLLASMGKAGKIRAEKEFSIEKMINSHNKAYLNLVHQNLL